jgi:hypothetical protein
LYEKREKLTSIGNKENILAILYEQARRRRKNRVVTEVHK